MSAVLLLPVKAHAITPGSGGWYWPVGTEDFQGWDGWWAYRPQHPPRWHMAQDMPAPVGHAVYAVGDGTILESGGDHGYGGVLVILHKTGAGEYFKAVYGHVIPGAGMKVGAKVTAGQVIARVNGCHHVHFGIHPGKAYPPDNNPYRGHTYDKTKTYGWVDSVGYLRTHPRVVKAPAVPVICTVETTGLASVLGVSDGSVYWTDAGSDPGVIFERALDETATVPAADVPASLDTTRFPAKIGPTSFAVSDRRPVLTMSASDTSPSWKRAVTVTGRLTNAVKAPFIGTSLVLETSVDGSTWTQAAATFTSSTGAYSIRYTPSRRVGVRIRFSAASAFLPAFSRVVTIAPEPAISAPAVPATAACDGAFTARGTLTPRHTAGPGAIVLRAQRKVAGAWTDVCTASTVYRDSGAVTTYSGSLTLAKAGSWRVRAECPSDEAHAAVSSAWTCFTLR